MSRPPIPAKAPPIDRDDGASTAMLYDGASISQLCKVFSMDARDVSRKMRNVIPAGQRRGFPIWHMKDAAQALVAPKVSEDDVLEYLSTMSFKNLPAALNKEVWNGMRARLRFEQEQGGLWETERVQKIVNAMIQTFRMGVLLLPDRLAREETLTTAQRERLQRLADEVLEDMKVQLQKAMARLDKATPGIMDYSDGDTDDEQDDSAPQDEADGVLPPVEDFSDL